MEIFDLKTMAKTEITEKTIVALGTFDGCHYAHQRVLSNAFYEAKRLGVKSVVYTFRQIPRSSKGIFTLEEKIKAFARAGLDYVAIDDFDRVKNISPYEFFDKVLISTLNAVGASCGYDYRFGKGREAGPTTLTTYFKDFCGGSVQVCEKISIGDYTVSSTLLRSFLENGEVERLHSFGTNFSIYSKVITGKRLGRELGFPTINQMLPKGKVVPKKGVYITECEIGEDVYPAITNIGVRPSVEDTSEINIETHIIGYDGILYHSYVRVNFYKFLREEIKFSSVEELKSQIAKDTQKAKEYFK